MFHEDVLHVMHVIFVEIEDGNLQHVVFGCMNIVILEDLPIFTIIETTQTLELFQMVYQQQQIEK